MTQTLSRASSRQLGRSSSVNRDVDSHADLADKWRPSQIERALTVLPTNHHRGQSTCRPVLGRIGDSESTFNMADDRITLLPPLRGDGHGKYRIWIVGNSGMLIFCRDVFFTRAKKIRCCTIYVFDANISLSGSGKVSSSTVLVVFSITY